MRPRSLYVHVPFCARRCSYCNFAVHVAATAPVDAWLDSTAGELRLLAGEMAWDEPLGLDTLYIGGGTPSLLGPGVMERLTTRLSPYAVGDPGSVEWTCEANPESFTRELAFDWRAAGVNRLSLGAQSFHEPVLRWMGRLHGPDGPARAMEAARAAGFENVSIDLIFGVPARFGRDWEVDLARAIALAPDHISLYGLTAEAGAPLGRWVSQGRESLADEEVYAEEYLTARQMLTEAGYEHYEVSNFCKPGLRSRHNFAYWTGAAYAALGVGAHGFYPPLRRWNLREWPAYREAILNDRLPIAGEERISCEDAALERVWLGLRTDHGFASGDASGAQLDLARIWAENGLARLDGAAIRLTGRGWLLLDRLAVDFAAAGEIPAATGFSCVPARPQEYDEHDGRTT